MDAAERERQHKLDTWQGLVEALQQIAHDENTSYLACPGPPNCDHSHYPTCPVQIARDALKAAR